MTENQCDDQDLQPYESKYFVCTQDCMRAFIFRERVSLNKCFTECFQNMKLTVMEEKIQDIEKFKDDFETSPALETMECAYKCVTPSNITKTLQCFTECIVEDSRKNKVANDDAVEDTKGHDKGELKLKMFFELN